MHDLEITWPEGQARFSPDESPVQIGRSPDAAVILTEPSVSRRHIEFNWTGTAWTAADSSTHGSFDPIGVRLAPNWTVGTNTTIRLGGVEGVELRIELVTTRPEGDDALLGAPPPPLPADQPPAPPGLDDVAGLEPPPPAYDQPPPSPAFDAPPPSAPPPPSVFDAPASGDLGLGSTERHPAPAEGDSAFDQPPAEGPSPFDQPPPDPRPAPPPGYDAEPPAYDPPPQPAAPSAFDAPPPEGRSAFDQPPPEGPSAFDAPPPEGPSAFDQPPPEGPSAFDAPPPEGPSAFDRPPPDPEPAPAPGYDGGPPAYDPPPQPAAFDAPPAYEPPAYEPPAYEPPAYEPPAYEPPANEPPAYEPPGERPLEAEQAPPEPAPAQPGAPSAFDAPPAYEPPEEPGHAQPPGYDPPGGAMTGLAATTAISDATIQLSIDGRDYTFLPGTEVTVGRDPSCLVNVDERHSLVSRRHLKISYRDANWWIEDFSSKGTFIDGKRVSAPYKAEGAFMAQLGDDDAGTGLRVITAGEHRTPRRQSIGLLIAIGLLALLAIAALALALRGGGNDSDTEAGSGVPAPAATAAQPIENAAGADLTAAKQATVLLLADEGIGSGFFVSDNLIVTNQHVAELAPSLFVAVSRETDEPAIVEYEAETVALHPYLDIAVLKLTIDLDGNTVDTSGLVAAPLGDSGALTLGDDVYNTGFSSNISLISSDDMGALLLPPVGTTSGEAASFAIWPGCSNPDFQSFIPEGSPPGVTCAPDGDVDRGIVITTFSSGQGASGSPVFHGNQVVAVVFAGPLDEANAGRNITTASFSTWLDDVIAANT